jgi:hypothetical protein
VHLCWGGGDVVASTEWASPDAETEAAALSASDRGAVGRCLYAGACVMDSTAPLG